MFYSTYFVISMMEATIYEEINHFLKGLFLPLTLIGPAVSEEKMFKSVDDRRQATDDGGLPIL